MYASLLTASTLLPLLALAAPIAKRDAASIVTAINQIETNINSLNTTLNGFKEGDVLAAVEVLEIQQETETLGDSISAAAAAANASAPLNDTESGTVATAVVGLEPQIFSLLDNIQRKKPAFDSAILGVGSVSPQVEQDLEQQKALSAELGNAITAKLTQTYAAFAPVINQQIADAFDQAIATFATSGGLFALPPVPSFDAFESAVTTASQGDSSSGSDGLLGGIL
ncbi:Hypothetical predicted protein [Lecanosticta acicola]|uniref:Cell wall mannoprotein 1 n=1 Tax=Lecanosticta acicola TaxID=111012 RepID=A0AAI9EEN0_9PEZI|nr:Hypothetical predicted protein [Lecanosticta acicola]